MTWLKRSTYLHFFSAFAELVSAFSQRFLNFFLQLFKKNFFFIFSTFCSSFSTFFLNTQKESLQGLVTFETLLTILTIENLDSWQSLWQSIVTLDSIHNSCDVFPFEASIFTPKWNTWPRYKRWRRGGQHWLRNNLGEVFLTFR